MRFVSVLPGLALAAALSVSMACSPHDNPSGPTDATIRVTGVTPTPAVVGTHVTITGSGFAATGNAVKIGSGYVGTFPSPDGTNISFALPDGLSVCSPFWDGPCVAMVMLVTPGEYQVSVLTKSAASNSVRLIVHQP